MFIKDCLKTKPIRCYCVEALYILFLVEEFMITSPLLFSINCLLINFIFLSKFVVLVSSIKILFTLPHAHARLTRLI